MDKEDDMDLRTKTAARRGSLVLAVIVITTLVTATGVFASHQYPDVPDSNPFHSDIDWATDNGLVEGFADGGYHPTAPVSRQAMAAFLHRTYDLASPDKLDRSFHVFVVCAASTRWAVVGSNGTFSRGSAGTTASRLTTGTYVVSFDINVSNCSWQVTVGQTGSVGATTGWATVAGRSGNANGLFITTYDVPAV
jgi:hypothetical protein